MCSVFVACFEQREKDSFACTDKIWTSGNQHFHSWRLRLVGEKVRVRCTGGEHCWIVLCCKATKLNSGHQIGWKISLTQNLQILENHKKWTIPGASFCLRWWKNCSCGCNFPRLCISNKSESPVCSVLLGRCQNYCCSAGVRAIHFDGFSQKRPTGCLLSRF